LDLSITTIKSDVYKFLERANTKYDVIFADAPYEFELELFEKIVALVFENNLLNEEGILVIEHSKQTNFKNHTRLSYQKKYGGNMFSFFENKEIA
jgi:16S rRNA G966 N2-methylase RsmD